MSEPRPLLLVRFKSGVVGETKRVCHLVPTPEVDTAPDVLTALCGTEIRPGEADLLPRIMGMPCESCMARAADRWAVRPARSVTAVSGAVVACCDGVAVTPSHPSHGAFAQLIGFPDPSQRV